jgi:hypothetical protein
MRQESRRIPLNLPSLEERIKRLLTLTANEIRPCKACQATIYMVIHNNGKTAPYTEDGLNHFINCPNAGQFRRGNAADLDRKEH